MAAPTHKYQGNPGYIVKLDAGITVLEPGTEVVLTDEEAEAFGDDFAPLKPKKPAPAVTNEGATP